MLTDKYYNEVIKPKMPEGFILIREYQMWGACPTIKNHSNGQVMFWHNGLFLQPGEMLAFLESNWRPVAQAEFDYASDRMHKELTCAQSKFK